MLAGSLIAGFLQVFLSKERLAALLPKRPAMLLLSAGCLGMVFPVCECAVVPVVRRFLKKGLPFSAALAYLLAGPIFNPVVGASTAVAYSFLPGWQTAAVTAIRMGGGLTAALSVAFILGRFFPRAEALRPAAMPSNAVGPGMGEDRSGGRGFLSRIGDAVRHGMGDFLDMAQYLILGAFLAAVLQNLIPRSAFTGLAHSPFALVGLMMGLAAALNLCSEADAFVAASFQTVLPLYGQMAFMILGPLWDLKLLCMYSGVFTRRAIMALSLCVWAVVFLLMILLWATLGDWYGAPLAPPPIP